MRRFLFSLLLSFLKNPKAGLLIELLDLPEDLRRQPAWVLKISQ